METNELTKLKKALHEGKVEFKYTKKDGTVREALGTLNVEVYGEENQPSGSSNYTPNKNAIRYYDLNSNGWRSFLIDNLIEWNAKD